MFFNWKIAGSGTEIGGKISGREKRLAISRPYFIHIQQDFGSINFFFKMESSR